MKMGVGDDGVRYHTICMIKQHAFAYHSIYSFIACQRLQPDLGKGRNADLAVFVVTEVKLTRPRTVKLPSQLGHLN